MKLPLRPALAFARGAGTLARLRGGGATSLPGRVLLALQPEAVALLARRLPRGAALISATNGKTTTAALAASVLERAGVALVHNGAGANMEGGIAATLLDASRRGGRLTGELGLFEVDEAWLPSVAAHVRPRAILLSNLFRDQLDRYGELDTLAGGWATMVRASASEQTALVLNADDPVVADLGRERAQVVYFGVQDDGVSLPEIAHAADAKRCRRCGGAYVFDAVYLGHLGRYRCPACGQTRPAPQVWASEIELHGVRGASFTLAAAAGSARVELSLPGLYNVYNALAAAALCLTLGVGLPEIAASLGRTRAAFGRAEVVAVQGRQASILLVKNPAGANEVLRTLALEPGQHDLLCVLNDNIADGRDVSWIWDADFEMLAATVRRVTCAGTRAPEIALRLKYAGVDPARIEVVAALPAALAAAIAGRPAGGGADSGPPPLFILPTYTAMLELRKLLVRRGLAGGRWST